ncbi:MAG: hypothetical protein AAGA75_19455 [Cyanobacteria bacterium P01_E01_bin.6]
MEKHRVGEFVVKGTELSVPEKNSEKGMQRPEKIKHILIGSPAVVHRTIQILHAKGYCEAGSWSHPVLAGGLGDKTEDVLVILIRHVLMR